MVKQSYTDKITQRSMHIHTHKKIKRKKICISFLPKSTTSILGSFVVYSGIPEMQGTSSWLWRFSLLLLRLLREISLSLLCSHSSWASALDLAPPLLVGHLRMSVPWLSSWLRCSGSLRQGGGRFTECGSTLRQQRSAWRCTSLRCGVCFPGEVVPGSRDPGSGWLHRLLGGEVWIVTCACTQASWWLQQQP